ncbi:MAG TPA: hypothetical protein VFE17_11235 [Candidatus Baltobacteraceae bacterium]|jgi:hypothetical protein|nr:hypothetical protein [Candidatus Baltobacteraceae bacterium]
MSPEWVGAVAAMGTFVVIAASAMAALIQMRHMRSANQIALFTAYNTEFDSPQFASAFAYVRTELPKHEFTQEELTNLVNGIYLGRLHDARTIGNFFEDMGSFVATGVLHQSIVCNLYSQNVLDAWHAMAPIAFFVRKHRDMVGIWENFEYLAVLAEQFTTRHPNGVYPKNLRRMPHDDSLIRQYSPVIANDHGLMSAAAHVG